MPRPEMNILVLGASGPTGKEVVAHALARGHSVTAVVRDRRSVDEARDRLRVVEANVTRDDGALDAVVAGHDAVISALGRGKSFRSEGLITASMPRIVRAMSGAGVRRLIVTSGYGVGETYRDVPFIPRLFVRTLLRDIYADKEAGERVLRASALDWTLVYPSGLTDGPRTESYRAGVRLSLRGVPTISRADVAHFLLEQVTDTTYVRRGVLVSA